MKAVIIVLLVAGFGIYAGWWTTTQVQDAGTQVVSAGATVAGAVGDAIKDSQSASSSKSTK